ncbi:MAG: hypothetical protein QG604_335 [Candidatus Dependentiae bacterium]|nr:hypothetical protein [Candidatus Dependentiae bacterium]
MKTIFERCKKNHAASARVENPCLPLPSPYMFTLMNDRELRALVAHLKIIVKRLTSADMSGDFSSAFRGSGLEFAHIRNYEMGDEIRSIDWKSSAKMNRLMVKEFVQERERTVMVLLDISASLRTGSQEQLKESYARNVAACLAMMAQNTNDKVGIMLFADKVLKYIAPRKGASYSAQAVHELLSTPCQSSGTTNFEAALNHLAAMRLRNAIVFVVSDWIAPTEHNPTLLSFLGNKNEAVAVRIIDPRERSLPDIGIVPTFDPETGHIVLLNTSGRAGKELNILLGKRLHDQKQLLRKHKFSVLDVEVGSSLVDALATFFHTRARS